MHCDYQGGRDYMMGVVQISEVISPDPRPLLLLSGILSGLRREIFSRLEVHRILQRMSLNILMLYSIT